MQIINIIHSLSFDHLYHNLYHIYISKSISLRVVNSSSVLVYIYLLDEIIFCTEMPIVSISPTFCFNHLLFCKQIMSILIQSLQHFLSTTYFLVNTNNKHFCFNLSSSFFQSNYFLVNTNNKHFVSLSTFCFSQ